MSANKKICALFLVLYPMLFLIMSLVFYWTTADAELRGDINLHITTTNTDTIDTTTFLMPVWVFPLLVLKPYIIAVSLSYGIWGDKQ